MELLAFQAPTRNWIYKHCQMSTCLAVGSSSASDPDLSRAGGLGVLAAIAVTGILGDARRLRLVPMNREGLIQLELTEWRYARVVRFQCR